MRSFSPMSLLEQGQLEQGDQDHMQLGFELAPRMETPQPLGNPFKCLTALTVKNMFSCVQEEFHVLQFVPMASCPVTCACNPSGFIDLCMSRFF